MHRAPQLQDLTFEEVHDVDVEITRRRCEHSLLEFVDVGLHLAHHVDVGVDDAVGDRVHHGGGTGLQMIGSRFESRADACQVGVVAVADGDDEIVAREDHDLAGLDDVVGDLVVVVVDVLDGPQD